MKADLLHYPLQHQDDDPANDQGDGDNLRCLHSGADCIIGDDTNYQSRRKTKHDIARECYRAHLHLQQPGTNSPKPLPVHQKHRQYRAKLNGDFKGN